MMMCFEITAPTCGLGMCSRLYAIDRLIDWSIDCYTNSKGVENRDEPVTLWEFIAERLQICTPYWRETNVH